MKREYKLARIGVNDPTPDAREWANLRAAIESLVTLRKPFVLRVSDRGVAELREALKEQGS